MFKINDVQHVLDRSQYIGIWNFTSKNSLKYHFSSELQCCICVFTMNVKANEKYFEKISTTKQHIQCRHFEAINLA